MVRIPESGLLDSDYQGKIGLERNESRTELPPSTLGKDVVQAKTRTSSVKCHQTQSGPLMPAIVLSHSMSENGRIFERFILVHHCCICLYVAATRNYVEIEYKHKIVCNHI